MVCLFLFPWADSSFGNNAALNRRLTTWCPCRIDVSLGQTSACCPPLFQSPLQHIFVCVNGTRCGRQFCRRSIDEKLAALGCFKTGSWTLGAERGQVPDVRSWIALGSAPAQAAARARKSLADSARMGPRGPILDEFRGREVGAQPYPQPFEK